MCDYHETVEKEHGRIEVRRVWSTAQVNWLHERERWPALGCVALVEAQRTVDGRTSLERRCYISSLQDASAKRLGQIVRGHWAIENSPHWVLDVAFDEDRCRVRVGHAARNLAVLRRMALNLLRMERTAKVGIQSQRLKAGWDEGYLRHVLAARV